MTCLFLVATWILTATVASLSADGPKPAAPEGADRYVVPQGDVPALVKYVERLVQYRPAKPAEDVEHRSKFRPALEEAAERIMKLEKDRGSDTYEAARYIVLANRVYWFARAVPLEQRRIIADVKDYLEEKLKQGNAAEAAALAAAAAKAIQKTGQWDLAAQTYESFSARTKKSDDEQVSRWADAMRASAEQLRERSRHAPKPSPIEIAPKGKLTPIDLSKKANWRNTDWSGKSYTGYGLDELPKGEQVLCGVTFRITERMLQLGCDRLPDAPAKIEGVAVGRKLRRLYFLHATGWALPGEVPEGTPIAKYTVHYVDGSKASIPVDFGRDVRDWFAFDEGMPVTRGRVVWTGSNSACERVNTTLRLFLGVWENPHPEKKVARLDFVKTEDTKCDPMCLAVTAEE